MENREGDGDIAEAIWETNSDAGDAFDLEDRVGGEDECDFIDRREEGVVVNGAAA